MNVDLTKTMGLGYNLGDCEIKVHASLGWKCPECGRVYSPTTPMCFYCGGNKISNTNTTYNNFNTTLTKTNNDYENDVAE